jgi:hypothetical protein
MKQKDLLILLVPMFLITILWVVFNIYHNYVTSTITDPLTLQIVPIDGKFNRTSLESIKDRKRLEPLFIAPVTEDENTSPTPSPGIEQVEETASSSAGETSRQDSENEL